MPTPPRSGCFRRRRRAPGSTSSAPTPTRAGLAPDRVIGSAVIDLPRAFLLVAREVQAGTFQPKVEAFGLASGVVRYDTEPRLAGLVPAGAQGAGQGGGRLDRRRDAGRRAAPGIDAGARPAGRSPSAEASAGRRSTRGHRGLPGRLSPGSRGAGRAQRGQRPAGGEHRRGRPHRRRGGRVAGDDRRRGGAGRGRDVPGARRSLLVHHGLFWDGNVPVTGPALPPGAPRCSSTTSRSTPRTFRSTCIPKSATTWCWPSGSASGWRGGSATTEGFRSACGATLRRAGTARRSLARGQSRAGTLGSGARLIAGGPERVLAGRHHHRWRGQHDRRRARGAGSTPTSPAKGRTTPTSMRWSGGST